MNCFIETFNVPIGEQLFEVKVTHDPDLNTMVIKVNGEIQAAEKSKKFLRNIEEYQFVVMGNDVIFQGKLEKDGVMVTIITTRQADKTYKYSVKINGRTLKKYKEEFRGKFLIWEIDVDEEKIVKLYLDKDRNVLWFGGRRIGRRQFQLNRFLMWFTIDNKPGEITKAYVNRKLVYICTYNNRRYRSLDFEWEDI